MKVFYKFIKTLKDMHLKMFWILCTLDLLDL